MAQAELELQLKAWKKLAVSKQLLIGAATDALGLDAVLDLGPDSITLRGVQVSDLVAGDIFV